MQIILSPMQRGMIYMVIGAVIAVYALGFFRESLHSIIFIGALCLALYGFIISGLMRKIVRLLDKKQE